MLLGVLSKLLLFLSVQIVHQMTMGIVPQSLCVETIFTETMLEIQYGVRQLVLSRTCPKWKTTCSKYDQSSCSVERDIDYL